LSTVLAEAGVKPEAKWMLAEGADSASMTRSIPIEKALDDALLAYAQNGERLRPSRAIRSVCCCPDTRATPTSNGFGA
jgi:sulfane dehydrogenase subunit SoxC